jgi:hypothetical protein
VAADFGVDSKVALDLLKSRGEFVKSASSSIAPPVARRLARELEARGYLRVGRPLKVAEPFSLAASSLLDRMPATIPRFADLLLRGLGNSGGAAGLRAAIVERHFFYTESVDVPERSGIPALALPSPSGMGIIRRNERLWLVAWSTATDRIAVHAARIDKSSRGVALGGYQLSRARLHAARYIVPDGESFVGVSLLSTLIRPTKLRPSSSLDREPTADAPRVGGVSGERARGSEVSIVYLSSSSEDTHRRSAAARRTARWQVRGHWRNQWHPTTGLYERIWIDSHPAGPADGRPLVRDVVYVIRADESVGTSQGSRPASP